jgi:hypothetical protein
LEQQLNTPILFLIFNRPDTTKKVFESISKARPKRLYIAADGPRMDRPAEQEVCLKTREIVNMIDWPCEVKTLFREKNLGCKIAVSSAINWFFENEEEGIILEDDCLPVQSFYVFCQTLLSKYRTDESVMHIGGCNVFNQSDSSDDYSFISYPLIWGWATWRRAWKKYDVNMTTYSEVKKTGRLKDIFPKIGTRNFWENVFDKVVRNVVNTWDYQWSYAVLMNDGLCIVPTKNLVQNLGFTEEATHTSGKKDPRSELQLFHLNGELKHPASTKIDLAWNNLLEKKYFSFSFIQRVALKLKKA